MPSLYLLLFFFLFSCRPVAMPASAIVQQYPHLPDAAVNPYPTIAEIPLPPGFTRVPADYGSYPGWLRRLPLKKNTTVYLFNGLPKANQTAQFAVLDVSTGHKDLQQCADAVMRLRAEYLYAQHNLANIDFTDNAHTHYRLPVSANRAAFDQYLEKVFSYCGTASLEKQLSPITAFSEIAAGDVLIKGGSPGHAMQVMDLARNSSGKKIYLLAQGYMPAQDIHVVINPLNPLLSPWYEVNAAPVIETPEWVFMPQQLKKW